MISFFDTMTTSDGAALRYGVWRSGAADRRGSIVLLSGRNEFMEKYEEAVHELVVRRWDVYSFDWRGQGLSSRMLPHRHKGHIEHYRVYIDDLDRFLHRVVLPDAARPIVGLAHSMGGHILLRTLAGRRDIFSRVVLSSPMIDICTGLLPPAFARFLTRTAVRLGLAAAYAPGERGYRPPGRFAFRYNRLTSDMERFLVPHRWIARHPALALGGVTFGWIQASFDSIAILATPQFSASVSTPILIVSAGDDKVVSMSAQSALCNRLPDCRLVSIPDARHEILMEQDHFRAAFWWAFDAFMSEKGTASRLHSESIDSRSVHRS